MSGCSKFTPYHINHRTLSFKKLIPENVLSDYYSVLLIMTAPLRSFLVNSIGYLLFLLINTVLQTCFLFANIEMPKRCLNDLKFTENGRSYANIYKERDVITNSQFFNKNAWNSDYTKNLNCKQNYQNCTLGYERAVHKNALLSVGLSLVHVSVSIHLFKSFIIDVLECHNSDGTSLSKDCLVTT